MDTGSELKAQIDSMAGEIQGLQDKNTALEAVIEHQSLTQDYFYVNDHLIPLYADNYECFPAW